MPDTVTYNAMLGFLNLDAHPFACFSAFVHFASYLAQQQRTESMNQSNSFKRKK